MSKLKDLIKEKCPNGVKFYKIKEISSVTIGEFVHKNKQSDDGQYPVYNAAISNTGFYDEYNNDGHKVIISARGANAGFINRVKGKYWAGNSCYTININDESKLDWNYLYQYLKNNQSTLLGVQQTGSIPAISKKQVEEFKIAIPPLEVQEEIARIIDKFGELEAELEAELEVRKNQYEFWRGKLLNDGNELVKLKEVCDYSNDKISYDKLNEDNYVGVDNLLQNKKGKTKSYHVPTSGNSTKFEKNDILVGNIRPYLRKIWFADCYGGTNGDVLDIRVNDTKKIYPRFLYYVLSSEAFFEYNNSNSKGAKMPRGDKQAIMNYEFVIPSIDKQIHIAGILDQFDKLVNNISDGLPAEIELRRKQYEYYRNKLLSFEELQNE